MSTLDRVIQVHEQSDLFEQQLRDVESFAENYEFFTPNTRAAFNPNFVTHWCRRSDYFLVIVSRKTSRGFGLSGLSRWNVSFSFIIPRKNCALLEPVGRSMLSWENSEGELVVCNHQKRYVAFPLDRRVNITWYGGWKLGRDRFRERYNTLQTLRLNSIKILPIFLFLGV